MKPSIVLPVVLATLPLATHSRPKPKTATPPAASAAKPTRHRRNQFAGGGEASATRRHQRLLAPRHVLAEALVEADARLESERCTGGRDTGQTVAHVALAGRRMDDRRISTA